MVMRPPTLPLQYRVHQAKNGGWIVYTDDLRNSPFPAEIIGAFTTPDDLLQWLTKEHKMIEAARSQGGATDD